MEFLKDWRGKRVLVTGGSGFIGRHVACFGKRAGVEVHTVSAHDPDHPLDIADGRAVFDAVRGVNPDGILHLAAAGVTPSTTVGHLLDTNVTGTINILTAAADLRGVPVMIAGSGYEYAAQERPIREVDPVAPASPYGMAKAAATLCAMAFSSSLPLAVLRLFNVYGPGERLPRIAPYMIEQARRGDPIELTGCEQVRDFVYVEDAAEAFWRALANTEQAGNVRVVNVGSGSAVPLRTFVECLAAILRRDGLKVDLRFGARPYRAGEPMFYAADTTRLQGWLGWLPRTPLSEGVLQTVREALSSSEIMLRRSCTSESSLETS
jgi:nucleoside-diphosphate-sugar epimerase